ncbi:MAG: BatA domain-containing protein, partial [Kiritimatiellae bacterium]|nr:BatA domain-containing protein [Kiritimatiellia bacterium]
MMFLHPYILWLLPLAAAAIVLYIIFRRRQTIVSWGATFILRLALASGRRQSLWKQIIVVALRTVFLLLLLLAFARPFRVWTQEQATRAFPHGPGTLHRVILLDNTLSMNARHGIQTRFDAARTALEALLVDMRPGDTCHIIPLCPWEPGGRIVPQTVSVPIAPRQIQSLAQKMKPVSGDMDFSAALRAA